MKNLNVLIKPSSNKCNLKCKYCFYDDVSHSREISDYDYMTAETATSIIDNVFSTEDLETVHFGFQGGEPTLSGIEFFENFFNYVNKTKGNVEVAFSLQTNGILIDQNWTKLFKENNVLVGLSLDGPAKFHDNNRIDFGNKHTHSKVMATAKLMRSEGVAFNVLTVVTSKNAVNIEKIYDYLVKNGFTYLQFIPVLEPLDYKVSNIRKVNDEYYKYLSNLYKAWIKDYKAGKYVSVRFFDNMINIMLGGSPEACDMRGVCSVQNIIEADGTTFTCDFYAIDKYSIGNATTDKFVDMMSTEIATDFVMSSTKHPEECKNCEVYALCRNGCRRMRSNGKYMYCDALKKFLRTYGKELNQVAIELSMRNR